MPVTPTSSMTMCGVTASKSTFVMQTFLARGKRRLKVQKGESQEDGAPLDDIPTTHLCTVSLSTSSAHAVYIHAIMIKK